MNFTKCGEHANNIMKTWQKTMTPPASGGSYGQFIDRQERRILQKHLPDPERHRILDLACGTGRLLNFATDGLDSSQAMLQQAQAKHPRINFHQSSALDTPFPDDAFDAISSFHFLMHLDLQEWKLLFEEVYRILRPGGQFIFDIPSQYRRNLLRQKAASWHGATGNTLDGVRKSAPQFEDHQLLSGVLFSPVHHFPEIIRPIFFQLDSLFCRSFLKPYASYLVLRLKK